MTRKMRLAGLNVLLAMMIAFGGFAGMAKMTVAQESGVLDVNVVAGDSGLTAIPAGLTIEITDAVGDPPAGSASHGAMVGGETLPLNGVPFDVSDYEDGDYIAFITEYDLAYGWFTVKDGVADPAEVTLTLENEPEEELSNSTVSVVMADGSTLTGYGMAWAIDDASIGGAAARIAEGSDSYDIPATLFDDYLAPGEYWVTIDPRPDYDPIQVKITVPEGGDDFVFKLVATKDNGGESTKTPEVTKLPETGAGTDSGSTTAALMASSAVLMTVAAGGYVLRKQRS